MAKKFRDLIAHWPPERIAQVNALVEKMRRKMPMTRLMSVRKVDRDELAARMRLSPDRLGKWQGRSDIGITAARRLVRGMGGELLIIARFPDREYRLEQPDFDREVEPGPADG